MIALEYEAYRVVSVRVPVSVVEFLRAFAVDYEVARGVIVKPADYVQKRGLAATRRAEYGHEVVLAEAEAYAFERVHLAARKLIFLFNID
jgi:hypothetical protein